MLVVSKQMEQPGSQPGSKGTKKTPMLVADPLINRGTTQTVNCEAQQKSSKFLLSSETAIKDI